MVLTAIVGIVIVGMVSIVAIVFGRNVRSRLSTFATKVEQEISGTDEGNEQAP